MVKSVVEDVPVRPKPSAGDIVVAQLKACTETEPIRIKNGPRAGETFTKLDWKFTIIEGQYEGTDIYGKTGSELSNHPDNDYRHYVEALTGQPLDVGAGVDTDDLLGLIVDIVVKEEPYTKNGVDKVAVKVGQVLAHDYDDQPGF
ncbi:MAG: hypothetical protein ACXVYY_00920 [Oryzihumus sp.]